MKIYNMGIACMLAVAVAYGMGSRSKPETKPSSEQKILPESTRPSSAPTSSVAPKPIVNTPVKLIENTPQDNKAVEESLGANQSSKISNGSDAQKAQESTKTKKATKVKAKASKKKPSQQKKQKQKKR